MKQRLDKLLVERGLAQSRERAQALVLAGRVLVDEQKLVKAGAPVEDSAQVRLLGGDLKFVGRGGLKLEGALNTWGIDVARRSCADIGASTGGFTDCMLQRGAASVLAIDTGYGQMAHSLRIDPRVQMMERTNARLLVRGQLAAHAITFFAMDVSFISATLVIPAVLNAFASAESQWKGEGVVLVKPQFEAGREHVGKGGIVRDPAAHALAIEGVRECVIACRGVVRDVVESPITGAEGNREFLLWADFAGSTPALPAVEATPAAPAQ
jgi:23S rRNA (cytidine1920-2'-O)/16S rRNA (cytidine1409-2'-O)-methyltransferase